MRALVNSAATDGDFRALAADRLFVHLAKNHPFFVSIEMTPKIAFAPLFISCLGFGLLPKVIIVFLLCFFPVVLNAILAFSSLSPFGCRELALQLLRC